MEWFLTEFESFVGVNFWTMIFAWCNLLILYLFLRKLLFNPIKNMIDSRQKEIDDMYADAEESRNDASKLKSEYDEKLERANEESEDIRRRALRSAQLKEEEILKEADQKAERILERAREEIELEKKRAVNDVKNEVSKLAVGIASAVIERDISPEEHKDLIDSFIEKIGESDE